MEGTKRRSKYELLAFDIIRKLPCVSVGGINEYVRVDNCEAGMASLDTIVEAFRDGHVAGGLMCRGADVKNLHFVVVLFADDWHVLFERLLRAVRR